MPIESNTPELWDAVWKQTTDTEQISIIEKEALSIRWARIQDAVRSRFGSFAGLKVVELGAGLATVSILMARAGAEITIIDYSTRALARCRSILDNLGVHADYHCVDALNIPEEFRNRFDVSMSFGLAEHFNGPERRAINAAHFDVLRPSGLAIISVPNAWCVPYRLQKFVAEKTGRWTVGLELPYSRTEYARICSELGISQYSFFGDYLPESFRFANPIRMLKKAMGRPSEIKVRREPGTPLDAYFSYALILCAQKPVETSAARAVTATVG